MRKRVVRNKAKKALTITYTYYLGILKTHSGICNRIQTNYICTQLKTLKRHGRIFGNYLGYFRRNPNILFSGIFLFHWKKEFQVPQVGVAQKERPTHHSTLLLLCKSGNFRNNWVFHDDNYFNLWHLRS